MVTALCVCCGCGSTFETRATMRRPAPLPVRAFPVVLVSGFEGPWTDLFVSRVVSHLSRDRTGREVRYVPLAQLEALRLTGRIPPPAVVVVGWVATDRRFVERNEPQTVTVCGVGGCYPQTVWRPTIVQRSIARVRITMFEGPTARAIATRELVEQSAERPSAFASFDSERTVVAALAERVPALFDQARVEVDVTAVEVDAPGAREGLRLLRAGRFLRAARSLAAFLGQRPNLERDDLAALHYDLGIAWQYAGRYRRALAALDRAIELAPDEDRYRIARSQAISDERSARIRAAQDAIARRNLTPGTFTPRRSAPRAAPPAAPAPSQP